MLIIKIYIFNEKYKLKHLLPKCADFKLANFCITILLIYVIKTNFPHRKPCTKYNHVLETQADPKNELPFFPFPGSRFLVFSKNEMELWS